MKTILIAALGWLSIMPVAAQTQPLSLLLAEEKAALVNAFEVYAPSSAMKTKAAISYHQQLLDSDTDNDYLVISLNPQQSAQLTALGFHLKPATEFKKSRIKALSQAQYRAQTLSAQEKADTIFGYSCYATVEGTYARAEQLQQASPQLAKWVDIGDSWQKAAGQGGYDLQVLQLTNRQNDKQKPILFIHAAMHAREYATAELALRFAEYLVNNYQHNADATWILDHHQVHILFQLNPDGRKRAESGLFWRKNTNESYCGSNSASRGADLNRNFSFFWNATNDIGSSSSECSETYRGPEPASEPETAAIEGYIRSIFADRRGPNESDAAPADTSGMHIDLHSFSQLVLWPWGHNNAPAPNADALTTLGRKLAFFNGYTPTQSIGLYPTDGTSDDVSYGELGVAAFTFELGTKFFQSCDYFEQTILPDNLNALLYAAKVVEAPYVLPKGPEAVDVKLNGLNTIKVAPGTPVTLTVTLDDGRFENSNGAEAEQNIAAAQYYFDQAPWQQGATAFALQPQDGVLDSSEEVFSSVIDTQGLADGRYLIYVRGQDSDGNVGPVSAGYLHIGQINSPPTASFSHSCTGLRCQFDGSASFDGDGVLVAAGWQLGDGTSRNDNALSIEHLYGADGEYQVSLEVTDDKGGINIKQQTITVSNLAPVALFEVDCTDNNCRFNAQQSDDEDGEIVSYQWQFGDGVSATGLEVSHSYGNGGTYEVTLQVSDNLALSGEKSQAVSVTMAVVTDPVQNDQGRSSGGALGWLSLILLVLGARGRRFILADNTRR